MPVITPVEEFKVNPIGNAPLVTVYVNVNPFGSTANKLVENADCSFAIAILPD